MTGTHSERLAEDVAEAVHCAASTGARVVACTCSTIGDLAEEVKSNRFVTMRIGRPMAELAVLRGPGLLLVATLASTLEPSRRLIEDAAQRARTSISAFGNTA